MNETPKQPQESMSEKTAGVIVGFFLIAVIAIVLALASVILYRVADTYLDAWHILKIGAAYEESGIDPFTLDPQ